MPYYDFKCPEGCGYFNDIFVPLAQHGKTTCPECESLLETVIGTVVTIGPTFSKPMVVEQIGRTFDSNKEINDYKRENPGWGMVSPDSKAWRDHKDSVREKVEKRSRQMGFNDLDHRRAVTKKEKAKQAGKLDKKIYSY